MDKDQLEVLRYPIGRFKATLDPSKDQIEQWIKAIEAAPAQIRTAAASLNDEQLDTPYREGGWTLRQVIHHVADSHLNSYIRFKWTLTEDKPIIKAYNEGDWAELPEAKTGPIALSLDLLDNLHRRWVVMLKNITDEQWERTFIHPESNKEISLGTLVGLYAWHGQHHLGHIEALKKTKGW
jgi:uncharacterized damage-inducible protein DinB